MKFKKWRKAKITGYVQEDALIFGTLGIKVSEPGKITPETLEAMRRVIKKPLPRTKEGKSKNKIIFRVFADHPYTKKPQEVRMGKGKGPVEGFEVKVKAGCVILEVNVTKEFKDAVIVGLNKALQKLGLKAFIIRRTAKQ